MRTDTHHARPVPRRALLRVRPSRHAWRSTALAAALLAGAALVPSVSGAAEAAPAAPSKPTSSPTASPTAGSTKNGGGGRGATPSSTASPSAPASSQKPTDDPSIPKTRPGSLTFGIGPAGDVPKDQSVDGRPYLRYLASPGATVRDSVAVVNFGNKPITLRVYATDAEQGQDGTFGLLAADQKPTETGSWFRIEGPASGKVTVPARKGRVYGRVVVPFEAKVPADAQPGDHVAGVLASLETVGKNADGNKLRFDQRIGVRAYFRVSGPINPKLAVENVKLDYAWSPSVEGNDSVTVTYDVRNTGNVRMNATQLIEVDRRFRGQAFLRPKPIDDLLPGNSLKVTQTLPTTFSALDLDTLVSVFPTPVDPELIGATTFVQGKDSAMAWQWPVVLVVTLLLLVALAFAARRAYRRYDAKRNRPGAPGSRRSPKQRRFLRRPNLRPNLGPTVAERAMATIGAAALAVLIALGATPAAHADVSKPDGGKIFLEGGQVTGDPAKAISDGVWGREGKAGTGPTFVSGDFTDSAGKVTDAAQKFWLKRFGVSDFNNLGVAFVRASKDGSTERPAVGKGKNAGEVFEWFTEIGVTTGLVVADGKFTDGGTVVHTLAEYRDWVRNGKPEQLFDRNLVAHDVLTAGEPVSAHPAGASILNRWKAGERISLVVFGFDGYDADGVPIVNVDDDGRAKTAWVTFETQASPADPRVATSGSYKVLSASPLPKTPEQVSDDPSAEVNGPAGAGVSSSGSPSASAPAASDPASGGGGAAAASGPVEDDGPAGIGTLWTGSGWTWPVVLLVLLVVAAVVGRTYLRRSQASS